MGMELLIGQSLALIASFCFAQNSLIYSHVGKLVSSSTTAHIRLVDSFPSHVDYPFYIFRFFRPNLNDRSPIFCHWNIWSARILCC